MLSEYLRLTAIPHPLGPIAQVARENNQRRQSIEVKISASLRDSQVVTAEAHNAIRLLNATIKMMVFPKNFRETKGLIA